MPTKTAVYRTKYPPAHKFIFEQIVNQFETLNEMRGKKNLPASAEEISWYIRRLTKILRNIEIPRPALRPLAKRLRSMSKIQAGDRPEMCNVTECFSEAARLLRNRYHT